MLNGTPEPQVPDTFINKQGRVFVFTSTELPILEFNCPYSAETVSLNDKYLTRLRLNRAHYLSNLQKLYPTYQFLPSLPFPKPGKEYSEDAYYLHEASFTEGKNYGTFGDLTAMPLTESIRSFSKMPVKTKSELLLKLQEIVCTPNSPGDGNNPTHKHLLRQEHLPQKYMSEHTKKITREMDEIYTGGLASNLQPAKTRFCILINGESEFHKTSLAKLIVKTMYKGGLVSHPTSYIRGHAPNLSQEKHQRLDGKEVIIMDDYDGSSHNGGMFDLLTDKDPSKYRVMNGGEGTTYLKGIIIPSPHTAEEGVNRADCTLQRFAPKTLDYGVEITGNDFKDRLFNVGPTKRHIYNTIIKAIPGIKDEPLGQFGRDTQLITILKKAMNRILTDLYNDKSMGGLYYDRSQIPTVYGDYQPSTELGAEPNIIRTFKTPSYEGLAERINALGDDLLRYLSERNLMLQIPPPILAMLIAIIPALLILLYILLNH